MSFGPVGTFPGGASSGGGGSASPHGYWESGRYELYASGVWSYSANDNYGSNQNSFSASSPGATEPDIYWPMLGHILQPGMVVNGVDLIGRINAEATDIKVFIAAQYPTDSADWLAGFNTAGELSRDVLYNDLWKNPVGPGDVITGGLNKVAGRYIDLSYTVTKRVQLMLYAAPVGTLTATRRMYANKHWVVT